MRRALFLLLAGFGLLLSACDDGGNGMVRRDGEPQVQMVKEDDPQMLAAFEAARESLPAVLERLDELKRSGRSVSIKVPVSEGGKVEHMWLQNVEHRDGTIHGNLANVPVDLPSWSYGDPIAIAVTDISDWMVVEGDQLYGAYTLFAMREKLQGEERAQFEAAVGLPFPKSPRRIQEAKRN